MEIQKEIEERKIIIEQLNSIDARLEARNLYLLGMYRGFISLGKQNTFDQLKNLITGGEQMKFQGISIIRRKDCNTWYARYRAAGKQFYISAKTQQQCYEKLKEALKNKNKQEIKANFKKQSKSNSITFLSWYKKWLELYKKDIKDATKKDYEYSLNYLKEIFNKQLDEISSLEILQLLNKVNFARRKQKIYELLNDIFKKAIVNEVIVKNPILKIDKPKHKKINGLALTNDDEIKIEKLFKEHNLDIYLVCLYQGLRRGEALALTIEDIDFKNKMLNINKSINVKNEIDSTKNIYSTRIMPLFDKTLSVLEKYKNTQGRIFNMAYSTSEKIFNKIVNENFNKNYTIHSLRHTFITNCQEKQVPLHIIQKWVGHNIGSSVTNQVYTHIRESAELENIKKINS